MPPDGDSDEAGDEDAGTQTHADLCAVEVADLSPVREPLSVLKMPAQTYAVFQHSQHVSQISATFSAAYNDWLPDSEFVAVPGPCVEAYGDAFDPQTGDGGFEVWIPVARL
ncbi:MAG: GyrI-like domain-containing protein [Pseudomonadales bacterium]